MEITQHFHQDNMAKEKLQNCDFLPVVSCLLSTYCLLKVSLVYVLDLKVEVFGYPIKIPGFFPSICFPMCFSNI